MDQGSREPEPVAGADDLVPGRYRLRRPLGRGGMGEVYLADDLRLRRQVAIKLVAQERLTDPEARRRLLKEAQAAAGLDHPYICPIYDSGETPDGRAFFVMQYVEGETLSKVLAQRAVDPQEALTITSQIAQALAAAHRHGIVHRDLKPDNVIITASGAPKLLDLGIAKVLTAPTDATTISDAISDRAVVGTPAYMSPEQVQQQPVDGRSDLFSLGAVVYEALTGTRAFPGSGPFETMANVLSAQPPLPSVVRPQLTDRFDGLCQKLLAKRPVDRFQSADDVVDAIGHVLTDVRTGTSHRTSATARRLSRRAIVLAVAALAIAASLGLWMRNRANALPPVPEEANRWYERGTKAIREGAYVSGRTALEKSIALFAPHVLAYARLAEADAELEDNASAQKRLLQAASFGAESSLPADERLRLRAVRALVLRNVDDAVTAYRELVTRRPRDAAAWLDLGRAQETAGLRTDAKQSFAQAIQLDPSYAAAFLRLGSVLADESKYNEALDALGKAQRLYLDASDSEGEVEVLIKRGEVQAVTGQLKAARADLERAVNVSSDFDRVHQQIRSQLALSSLTASEGHFADAEKLAEVAVQRAIDHDLDSVAAEGLIDLAALIQGDRPDQAATLLARARQLAERRGAVRTAARARLQQAAAYEAAGRARDALAVVDDVLPFYRQGRYRRYELVGLTIAARSHLTLNEVEQARTISQQVLDVARSVKDEAQEAQAANSLAAVTTVLGEFPEALRLRNRALTIHRQQGDNEVLPFDLVNTADLLVRLGRTSDAEPLLAELDAGIAKGMEGYVGRQRRVAYLRALGAATALRCEESIRDANTALTTRGPGDSSTVLSPGVYAFCVARVTRRAEAKLVDPETEASLARELHYWFGAAALEWRQPAAALDHAKRGLATLATVRNDEVRWRLAAVAAAAARELHDENVAQEMMRTARTALDALKAAWKDDYGAYERRLDLQELRVRAGIA
jgi:tetratricopeptide (TPR) repeat protein